MGIVSAPFLYGQALRNQITSLLAVNPMFTGIIQAVGKVVLMEHAGDGMRIQVDCGLLDLTDLHVGDSIAVNGVCLTAVALAAECFTADVSQETLACTTVSDMGKGSRVNLEKSLLPTTRLGGHLVSGHVDGVGRVCAMRDDGRTLHMRVKAPEYLARYIAVKGSICLDGVSLTVNDVAACEFELTIIPHTRQATVIDEYTVGRRVNIEVDIIARYLERMLSAGEEGECAGDAISHDFLLEHGFAARDR